MEPEFDAAAGRLLQLVRDDVARMLPIWLEAWPARPGQRDAAAALQQKSFVSLWHGLRHELLLSELRLGWMRNRKGLSVNRQSISHRSARRNTDQDLIS